MLGAYLQEFVVSVDVINDIIVAVNEACTNVLQHAFPRASGGIYCLRAELSADEVAVEVIDDGIGFDAMRYQPGDVLAVSGRGLDMLRRLMTTVEVESPRPDGGTRVVMRRNLSTAPSND